VCHRLHVEPVVVVEHAKDVHERVVEPGIAFGDQHARGRRRAAERRCGTPPLLLRALGQRLRASLACLGAADEHLSACSRPIFMAFAVSLSWAMPTLRRLAGLYRSRDKKNAPAHAWGCGNRGV
jgi:hypothetical protein